ncbi:MAG: hypothetical protein C0425_02010 [Chlorobiaceae bacterium]|nr:hypothetical protein [Chlorobiaceae bacterium]MBA4309093.1 hypothetical protein [Chlorobiaceae bacterium]
MDDYSDKIKILVVDDSDAVRYLLKRFFVDYNFEVITCIDGLEGIQRTVQFRPNIIFLDLMMPNFDGIKMLKVLKVLDEVKHIPVVIISSNTDQKNVLSVIEAGADLVLCKPLSKEAILKTIKEILGEDVLKQERKMDTFSEVENDEIQLQLKKFFIESFAFKKEGILNCIKTKNIPLLKALMHEIKGAGSSVGAKSLTEKSDNLEKILSTNIVDWYAVTLKCEDLILEVDKIETKYNKGN